MKKFLSFFLCVVFIFSLSACSGKPEGMSQEVYDYGCETLQLNDDFFDGKISFKKFCEESEKQFNLFHEYLDSLDPNSKTVKKELNSAKVISVYDMINFNWLWHESKNDNPNYEFTLETQIEKRNKLALALGKEKKEIVIKKILKYIKDR